jgi:hypothetical protein
VPPFRPGTNVITQDTPPPVGSQSSTGNWFVLGITEKGPVKPTLIQSMSDYQRIFGGRVNFQTLYDPIELFFHEQGASVWVNRVVGPAFATSSLDLEDDAAAVALTVSAKGPGTYGDSIQVAVTNPSASTYTISVTDGETTETSPVLSTIDQALGWARYSKLVDLTAGVSDDIPAPLSATPLAGGDDDRGSISNTDWADTLDMLDASYGPGQVSAPYQTDPEILLAITDHCSLNARVAVVDAPDTSDAAELKMFTDNLRNNGDYGGAFAPWLICPGSTQGTQRVIPPSGLVAGAIARNDPLIGPNSPSAGGAGISLYAIGVTQQWSDADREDLNSSSINVIRSMFGGTSIRIYGWRSLADVATKPNWASFGNARLRMTLSAEGNNILEGFMFDQIDGQNTIFTELGGALAGMMMPYYTSRQLYGKTPGEAFSINIGPQVNTPDSIAAREIHAVILYRDSPFVEYAELVLVKTPITVPV